VCRGEEWPGSERMVRCPAPRYFLTISTFTKPSTATMNCKTATSMGMARMVSLAAWSVCPVYGRRVGRITVTSRVGDSTGGGWKIVLGRRLRIRVIRCVDGHLTRTWAAHGGPMSQPKQDLDYLRASVERCLAAQEASGCDELPDSLRPAVTDEKARGSRRTKPTSKRSTT
jgi:hypothetical protein